MESKVIIVVIALLAFVVSMTLIAIDKNKEINREVIDWIATSVFKNSTQSKGVAERLYTFVKNIFFLFCVAIIVGAFIALG